MQIKAVVQALLDHSGKSSRSISLALGKAENWARQTSVNSKNPKLGTITSLADLAGCDIAIVDRATGETIATIDPPKRGEG